MLHTPITHSGIETFYGIRSGDPNDAYFYEYDCHFGFETFGCAMFVLFQCMTTSNWHEIMNSFMNHFSQASALYFVMFFLIVNLVLMNLMVAVTIEAFMTARSAAKEKSAKAKKMGAQMISAIEYPMITLLSGKKAPAEAIDGGAKAGRPSVTSMTSTVSLRPMSARFSIDKRSDGASNTSGSSGTDVSLPKRKKRGSRFSFRRGSTASSIRVEDHPTENGHRRLLRKLWRTAAREAAGQPPDGPPGQSDSPTVPVARPADEEEGTATQFRVIRRHGSWRRELVQKKSDALGLIERDDIKALSKASGSDVSKLLAEKREKRRQLANNAERRAIIEANVTNEKHKQDNGSLLDIAAPKKLQGKFSRMSITRSALQSVSPILRRYSEDSLLQGTADEMPEGGWHEKATRPPPKRTGSGSSLRRTGSWRKSSSQTRLEGTGQPVGDMPMRRSVSSLSNQIISEEEAMSRKNSSDLHIAGEAGNSRITKDAPGWRSESTKTLEVSEAAAARRVSTTSCVSDAGILTDPLPPRPAAATTPLGKVAETEAAALMSAFPGAIDAVSTEPSPPTSAGAQVTAATVAASTQASPEKSFADAEAAAPAAASSAPAATPASLGAGDRVLGVDDSSLSPTLATGTAPTPPASVASSLLGSAPSSGNLLVKKTSLWKLKRGSIKKLARDSLAQAEAAVKAAENAANSDSDGSSDGDHSENAAPSRRQSEISMLEIDPHNDEDAQEAVKGIASLKTQDIERRASLALESTPTAEALKQARAGKSKGSPL